VLTPAAVFLNGTRVDDLQKGVSLRAGPNPILVRYDRAGRGYGSSCYSRRWPRWARNAILRERVGDGRRPSSNWETPDCATHARLRPGVSTPSARSPYVFNVSDFGTRVSVR
jgi:hypothetical protein